MGASVCTADGTSLLARCLCVHGGSDVVAGLSPSVYTFIGHSAPKGTISVCTRIEDICGLVGVLAQEARISARRPLSSTVMYGADDRCTYVDRAVIWRYFDLARYNVQRLFATPFRLPFSTASQRVVSSPPSATPTFRKTVGVTRPGADDEGIDSVPPS